MTVGDHSTSINNPNDTPAKAAVDTSPVVEPNLSTMAVVTVCDDEDGVQVVPHVDDSFPEDGVEDKYARVDDVLDGMARNTTRFATRQYHWLVHCKALPCKLQDS